MDRETSKAIDRRLARIEGQVRGLRRMLDQGEYCCDVLTQLTAVRSALDQVGAELAASHVRTCIAGQGGAAEHAKAKKMTEEELVDELRVVLSKLVK